MLKMKSTFGENAKTIFQIILTLQQYGRLCGKNIALNVLLRFAFKIVFIMRQEVMDDVNGFRMVC